MRRPALALLTFMLLPSAHAQMVDVSGCRAVQNPDDRFRCYEALSAPTSGSLALEQRQASSVPPSSGESQARTSASEPDVDNFGARQARLGTSDDGEVELFDTVASVVHYLPNQYEVTLSSGQVWRQVTGKRYLLEEGDEVRIYPTFWGDNYRMTALSKNGFIEVKRLR